MTPVKNRRPVPGDTARDTPRRAIEVPDSTRRAITHLEELLQMRAAPPLELAAAVAAVCEHLHADFSGTDADPLRREWIDLLELADEALAAAEMLHDPPLAELLAFARAEATALAARLHADAHVSQARYRT